MRGRALVGAVLLASPGPAHAQPTAPPKMVPLMGKRLFGPGGEELGRLVDLVADADGRSGRCRRFHGPGVTPGGPGLAAAALPGRGRSTLHPRRQRRRRGGLVAATDAMEQHGSIRALLADRRMQIFAGCVTLFHFSSAAQQAVTAAQVTRDSGRCANHCLG